jgi:thiol-disulfide isomerase/thioredoxin
MKRLMFCVLLCCAALGISAQGIQFYEGSWSSALQQAKQTNKLVFIDVYTSWCGPCKKMATQTFTKQEVGDFYNSHFINFHIDAEKGEGIAIAKKYNVTAYPTCMFITSTGEIAYMFRGAKEPKEVIKEGNDALKFYKLMPHIKALKAEYTKGNRDKAFLKDYVTTLKESGSDPGLALDEYLNKLTDAELLTKESARLIAGVSVYDKVLFGRLSNIVRRNQGVDSVMKRVTMPVMKAISTCVAPMLQPNNSRYASSFEDMMNLKGLLHVDSNIIGILFGGISYEDTECLRCSFYENCNIPKFKNLFEAYMTKHLAIDKADSASMSIHAMRTETKHQFDSLTAAKDSVGLKKYNMTKSFSSLALMQFQMQGEFISDCAQKYWDSEKQHTPALKAKVAKWLIHANKLYNGIPAATQCATLLAKTGQAAQAKVMLKAAIDDAEIDLISPPKSADLEAAKAKLKEL